MDPVKTSVDGALTVELRQIPTPGGPVLHMLRADSPMFKGFGEVYFSEVEPGAVKAWKFHKRMTQHFAAPVGRIKVVLYDDREGSPTRGAVAEVELGRPDAYNLLRIPPRVWYGFTCTGGAPALVCNVADLPHDPEESVRAEVDDPRIPYRFVD